jgi:hypothetical protein
MRWFGSRIAVTLLLVAGCIVGSQDLNGKPCLATKDCPVGYVCRPLGSSEDTVCVRSAGESGSLPDVGAGAGGSAGGGNVELDGGGTGGTPDGGSVSGSGGPYYCDAVKPILDARCVSCHGATPSGGAPSYMRLDVYGQIGAIQGAGAQASRIVARAVVERSMPPPSWPRPTEAELSTLASWLAAGAPECAAPTNAVPPGSGQPDAGIGAVPEAVSFSMHVQPIFDAYCVSCHRHDLDQGNLELERGRAYDELLRSSRCDSNLSIVAPYDPRKSLLWLVLSADASSCAPPMPFNTPGLQAIAPTEFAIVEKWIIQGALDN